jgi:hypothetical protein
VHARTCAVITGRADDVSGAEAAGHLQPPGVHVDRDDGRGSGNAGCLDRVEPDPAAAEHHDAGARLDAGRVGDRAEARRHTAPDDAGCGEGHVVRDADDPALSNHGGGRQRSDVEGSDQRCIVERRTSYIRMSRSAEAADDGGVGLAEVLVAAQACGAQTAVDGPVRHDVVADPDARDIRTDGRDYSGALVSEDAPEALTQDLVVGVADAAGAEVDEHLARPGVGHDDVQHRDGPVAVGHRSPGRARHPLVPLPPVGAVTLHTMLPALMLVGSAEALEGAPR